MLVDTLAEGLSLEPLYELFRAPGVVKVFHAARQDLEIFATTAGVIPQPFFDTQVAAMVCGYGDQVGYETLARQIARAAIDKSSRFTDWSAAAAERRRRWPMRSPTSRICARSTRCCRSGWPRPGAAAWVEEELARPDSIPRPTAPIPRPPGRGSRPARPRRVPRRRCRSSRGSARRRRAAATCRARASSRTTRCWSWPPTGRARSTTWASRGCCCARRGGATSPTASSRRSPPPRRCRPAALPRVAEPAGAQAGLGGAGRPAAGAAEGAGRRGGRGAAADRLGRRSRRDRRRGGAGRAGAARLAATSCSGATRCG